MRLVVFTANPGLQSTPWWSAAVSLPGVDAVLLCEKRVVRSPEAVLRRFRQNLSRHGVIWIPYRAAIFVAHALRRRRPAPDTAYTARTPIDHIVVADLHSADVLDRVRAFAPDLGVSLGAPILRRPLFSIPRRGTINLHLGKVPEFRGAPVGFWELARGSDAVGATIHWVDDGLDTGPVLAAAEAPIYERDTLANVQARAAELGARLLAETLSRLERADIRGEPQAPSHEAANRFPTVGQEAAVAGHRWLRRNGPRAATRRGAKTLAMSLALFIYRPLRDMWRSARRRHPVRVFTFHRVTHLCRDGMTVGPDVFAEQVRYITRYHDVVPLRTGIALIRSGARLRRPAAIITFDDGYRSVIDAAMPTLRAAGAVACSFVCTDFVGTERRFAHDEESSVRSLMDVMNWTQLKQLVALGWDIQSHTATHARLSQCSGAALERELRSPREVLRRELGIDADALAYPFGARDDFSAEALAVAQSAGYSVVFSNFKGENRTGEQSTMLCRIDLGGDHERLAWQMLSHGVDLAGLRSIWIRPRR